MEQNILGTTISSLRKEKGMTQDALAKQLGVTFQAVSKWENGLSCPDIVMLPELADLFGVSIDALFGRAPLAPEDLPAETTAPAQSQVVYGDLPWEDDRSVLHVVLFAGHRLVGDSLFQRHQKEKQRLEFCYEGPALNIESDFSVTCAEGTEIRGSVRAGNDVICGKVLGNVQAGNSVRCGDVGGSVRASDGIACGSVGGDVSAGDGVQCGNVGGSVRAGDSVACGSVGGDVSAGDSVRCTEVYGNAFGSDGVQICRGEPENVPPAEDNEDGCSFGIGSGGIYVNGKKGKFGRSCPSND